MEVGSAVVIERGMRGVKYFGGPVEVVLDRVIGVKKSALFHALIWACESSLVCVGIVRAVDG